MNISKINLVNFRNFTKTNINFNKNINILLGKNAQGKTNILESIYLLAITKSFRECNDENLQNFYKSGYKISARVKNSNSITDYTVSYDKNNKKVYINSNQIKRISDYISNINIIIFYPEDINFIKSDPSTRRKIINIEISQLYNEYAIIYNKYNKILKIRNEYLKKIYINGMADLNYFNILTDKLIDLAIKIYNYRNNFINNINQHLNNIYFDITGDNGIEIKYLPNITIKDFNELSLRKNLKNIYNQNYEKELFQGMTIYGPHRDDFLFLLKDREVKIYCSQGQQRISMIAFKLSEIKIIESIKQDKPIILIDDIFNEIDRKKKNNILDMLNNNYQIIITTTELKGINKNIIKEAKIFEIKNGTIKEKGEINEK